MAEQTVKKSKYQILNEINNKYNVYDFDITCYEDAYEFYMVLAQTHQLNIPAVQISNRDIELALLIIDNWSKYA